MKNRSSLSNEYVIKISHNKIAQVDKRGYVKGIKPGTTDTTTPSHTEGKQLCGTVEFMWVAPIARYEMR